MSNLIVITEQYQNQDVFENMLNYQLGNNGSQNNVNTKNKCYLSGGSGVLLGDSVAIINSFRLIKSIYDKRCGNMLHHFILTVYNGERLSKNDAKIWSRLIVQDVSTYLIDIGFQNIFFIHQDTEIIHIHFIINSINYHNGYRLTNHRDFYVGILKKLIENFPDLNWGKKIIFKKSYEIHMLEDELWMN